MRGDSVEKAARSSSEHYQAGPKVKVISGPFKDFSGVVEEANNEKQKAKVSVLIFGRATPVELDFYQIEPD
jgi:transcriptional antiterminator NusG